MALLRAEPHRFILFCDDLSFDAGETSYKSLKAVLEGGIEGRPDNVIFYATSNRRHLMPRDMIDNERSTAINPARRSRRRSRCPTASASGSASTHAARTTISPWSTAMCDHFGLEVDRDAARRGAGMGDDPRRALRPRRLAVHPGSGRAAGQGDLTSPPSSPGLTHMAQENRVWPGQARPCRRRAISNKKGDGG